LKSGWAQVVLTACAVLAVATSCRGSDGGDSSDTQSTAITNIDQFDPMTYHDVWGGDPSLPLFPARSISADEWTSLVERQRASGLLSLSQDERAVLLQGAVKAHLMLVRNTDRRMETPEGRSGVAREEYSVGEDALYFGLLTREQSSIDLQWEYSDVAYVHTGEYLSRDIIMDATRDELSERWDVNSEGLWRCDRSFDDGLGFAAALHYSNVTTAITPPHAAYDDVVSGRPALRLEYPEHDVHVTKVWIDQASLLPVKFGYPARSDDDSTQTLLPARTVTITGLNAPEPIRRPALCSECDGVADQEPDLCLVRGS
jgi:hypothetical protein